MRDRYAAQLAYAGQLAARYECGEVVGVFSRQADIGRKTVMTGLLPLVALPFLIIAATFSHHRAGNLRILWNCVTVKL